MSGKPIPEAVVKLLHAANVYLYQIDFGDEGKVDYVRAEDIPRLLTAAQQQGQAVAWQDEWRAAVAAKLSGYGLSEEAAAVFAESELGEYRAGLCDCAENDPADMVDLMMGVALDAIEKWKAESAGRPFGYKRTAPPSAPVGVDHIGALRSVLCDPDGAVCITGSDGDRAIVQAALEALAQQPAAGAVDFKKARALWDEFRAGGNHEHDALEHVLVAHATAAKDAEVEAAREDAADAARYRWLKAHDNAYLLAEEVIDDQIAIVRARGKETPDGDTKQEEA